MLIVIKKPNSSLLALDTKIKTLDEIVKYFTPNEKKSIRVINSCDLPTIDSLAFFPLTPDGLIATFINPKTNGYNDLQGFTLIVGENIFSQGDPVFFPARGTVVFARLRNSIPKTIADNTSKIILQKANYKLDKLELIKLSRTDLRIIFTMCTDDVQTNLLKKLIE